MTDYLNSRMILEAYERMAKGKPKADDRFRVIYELDVCEDVAKRIASNVVEMFESGKFNRDERAAEKTGYNFQWFNFENETYKASVSFQSEDDRELPEDIDGLLDLVGELDPDRVCEDSHFSMCFDVGTNRDGRDAPIIVKATKGMYPHGGYRKNCKSDGKVFSVFVDFRVVVKEDTDFDMLGRPFGKCLAVPDESRFGDEKSDFDDAEDDSVVDRYADKYFPEDEDPEITMPIGESKRLNPLTSDDWAIKRLLGELGKRRVGAKLRNPNGNRPCLTWSVSTMTLEEFIRSLNKAISAAEKVGLAIDVDKDPVSSYNDANKGSGEVWYGVVEGDTEILSADALDSKDFRFYKSLYDSLRKTYTALNDNISECKRHGKRIQGRYTQEALGLVEYLEKAATEVWQSSLTAKNVLGHMEQRSQGITS